MGEQRWISDLHWIRVSQQGRSQRTQDDLLDAAESLFAERGVETTTITDIATAANSSVGAIYHHFRDKTAILRALFDRYAQALDATTRAAVDPVRWQGAGIGDILQGYIGFSLEADPGRPDFKRAAFRAAQHDPVVAERNRELLDQLDQGVRDLLLARRDEISHPDPELAIAFVLEQLATMLSARLFDPPMPTRMGQRTTDEFVREAVRSTCCYLGVRVPSDLDDAVTTESH
ncbi:hypothetical protein BFN03_01035 [Rhodococcus sp. WMMA185]|uniref:TetR/AcrR family transcriptional regulator n=1 Tax=Rhodococcus sp. WMMA185 TaxID=679318 RepID=UPI00087812EE|nr:TetR/AcrR family transcriptional regulator [Rhodococcus sp. WMMA185]AOW91749.1 hypothetical protein BFN03_01035 [Rhodococcus sp. WMMA185]